MIADVAGYQGRGEGENRFPHLFSPIALGEIHLSNRIIMGAMHTGLESRKGGFEDLRAFYAERAEAEVGLIITGGYSPNLAGRFGTEAPCFRTREDVAIHRPLTQAVHERGGRIVLQILHTGRYAYHNDLVAPSALRAPINSFTPTELSAHQIRETISDFTACAELALEAGYDGVELMGSEGYLINEFLSRKTNLRGDEWGGDLENRMRFALEIVSRTRRAIGSGPLVIFRMPVLDLVDDGVTWEETARFANEIASSGATALNTGIGWHESRIPTVASMVPRGAFAFAAEKLKGQVRIPVIAAVRINTPGAAEAILSKGAADMVCLARPFLADPEFITKARSGRVDRINTCIGCNQACLDSVFSGKSVSCMVNPRACRERAFPQATARVRRRIAVVGSGPAGLAFSLRAVERGHDITLFEASDRIGGQFNLSSRVPGKEEFRESIRYFGRSLQAHSVKILLNRRIRAKELLDGGFDKIVLATGTRPKRPDIPGADSGWAYTYEDVLSGKAQVGSRVAIIGAGGIGIDIALFLSQDSGDGVPGSDFYGEWGVDLSCRNPGGLAPRSGFPGKRREVHLLQRRTIRIGASLGKTTGWIHAESLRLRGVRIHSGVRCVKILASGLVLQRGETEEFLEVDSLVFCTGQEARNELSLELDGLGAKYHVIGGARGSGRPNAMESIEEAWILAASI